MQIILVKAPPKGIYNFCDLPPAAQSLIFRQIMYFDIAANEIAKATDQIVVSVRSNLLNRINQACDGDSAFVVMYFALLAGMHNLPPETFDILNQPSRHFALFIGNLMIAACADYEQSQPWDAEESDLEAYLREQVEINYLGCAENELESYFRKLDAVPNPLPFIPEFINNTEVL